VFIFNVEAVLYWR